MQITHMQVTRMQITRMQLQRMQINMHVLNKHVINTHADTTDANTCMQVTHTHNSTHAKHRTQRRTHIMMAAHKGARISAQDVKPKHTSNSPKNTPSCRLMGFHAVCVWGKGGKVLRLVKLLHYNSVVAHETMQHMS